MIRLFRVKVRNYVTDLEMIRSLKNVNIVSSICYNVLALAAVELWPVLLLKAAVADAAEVLAVVEGSSVDELASVSGALKAFVTGIMADDVLASVEEGSIVDVFAAAEVGFDSSELLVVEKLSPEHVVAIYRINWNTCIKIFRYMHNKS
jgi:hypothetical protein